MRVSLPRATLQTPSVVPGGSSVSQKQHFRGHFELFEEWKVIFLVRIVFNTLFIYFIYFSSLAALSSEQKLVLIYIFIKFKINCKCSLGRMTIIFFKKTTK